MSHTTDPSAPQSGPTSSSSKAGGAARKLLDSLRRRRESPPEEVDRVFDDGQLIGARYRVGRQLARGGMGQVYEVEDLELGSRVALKTLHRQIAASTEAAEKLKQELRLARAITHENVCRVFDVGRHTTEDDDILFVTMELVGGETLGAWIRRRGPLPVNEALDLAAQICRGLAAAHRRGVIHRDIKTGNILVSPEEGGYRAVITDFGLACTEPVAGSRDGSGGGASGGSDSGRSGSGGSDSGGSDSGGSARLEGTPLTMAPEQVEGGRITPATDVYAVGTLLFHLLTGAWPFQERTLVATAVRRIDRPAPSVHELRPDLPGPVEQLTQRCLELDPSRRLADASELLGAIEEAREGLPGQGGRKPIGALAVGLALIAAAALGVWLLRPSPPASQPTMQSTSQPTSPAEKAAAAFVDVGIGVDGPHDPRAARLYAEGMAALRRGDPLAARRALLAAAEVDGRQPLIQIALSRAWSGLGKDVEALAAAQQAFASLEGSSREHQLLVEARYRLEKNDWKRAEELYRSLHEFYPDQLDYGLGLAEAQDRAGRLDEAAATLERLRSRSLSPLETARVDFASAMVAYHQGDYAASQVAAGRAASGARSLGAPALLAAALQCEALTRVHTDPTPDTVLSLLAEAQEIHRERGDLQGLISVLQTRGAQARRSGDLTTAEALYRESLELAHQTVNEAAIAKGSTSLAMLLDRRGRLGDALVLKEAALASYRRRNIPQGAAITLENLAISNLKLGRLAEAQARFEEAARAFEELGDGIGIAWAPYWQGRVWLEYGELDLAATSFEAALSASVDFPQGGLGPAVRFEQARLELARGSVPEAHQKLEGMVRDFEAQNMTSTLAETRLLQARAAVADDDTELALRLLAAAAAELERQGARDTVALAAIERVWASHRLGLGRVDAQEGDRACRDLDHKTEGIELATVDLRRAAAAGLCQWAVGEGELRPLESAAARSRRLGLFLPWLEANRVRAEILHRLGRDRSAATVLRSAADQSRDLGWHGVANGIEERLDQLTSASAEEG